MNVFHRELELHLNGILTFAAFALIYPIQHFLLPFAVQTNALLIDLTIEMVLSALIAFSLITTIRRRSFRPVTQIFWLGFTLSIGMLYLLLIPTVLDRSLSVYMLSQLQPATPISTIALASNVQGNYFSDYDVISTRLIEQSVSGNISVDGDNIEITSRGERIVALTENYRTLLASKYQSRAADEVDR